MTVKDLIERLGELDPNAVVLDYYNSGYSEVTEVRLVHAHDKGGYWDIAYRAQDEPLTRVAVVIE